MDFLDEDYIKERDLWLTRNRYFYSDIKRLFGYLIPEGSSVLEISFDDGWLLDALKPKTGMHLGFNKTVSEQGRNKYPRFKYVTTDEKDKLRITETFDYIILLNVVGSVTDLQGFFEQLHSVSNKDTKIVVTFYNYLWEPVIKLSEFFGFKQKQRIQNWLSVDDLAGLLDLANFEVIRDDRRLLWPKKIPIVSWFLNRLVARLPFFHRLNFWNYIIARPRPEFFQAKQYSVSVVVPVRNEKGMIGQIATRVPDMGEKTEIVFVEGGSHDGSWEEIIRIAKEHEGKRQIKFLKQTGQGKGDAVRAGFDVASGEILMILDADLTVPPEELGLFYKVAFSGQAEFVNGSRLVYPMEKQAMRFLNLLANKFFSLVFTWFLRSRVKDTLCGTKALFKKDYLKIAKNRRYFGDFDPFGDFDLIFGAHKLGLKIAELPVHYKERRYGQTNISRFRHGWLLLKMCMFAATKIE